MALLLIFLFCLLNNINCDLQSQRFINAEKWIKRTHPGQIEIGYGSDVVTPGICHIVQTVGQFCGQTIAKEYDSIVLFIEVLGSIAPIKVFTIWDPSTTQWLTNDVLQVDFEMNITTAYDYNTGQYLVQNQTARLREYITFEPSSPLITIGYTVHDTSANKMFALADATLPNSILCAGLIFPACNISNGQGGNFLTDTGFSSISECISFMDSLGTGFHPCPHPSKSNTTSCRSVHALAAFLRPDIHCQHVRPYDSVICKDSCLPACSMCDENADCIATFPGIPTNFTTVFKCKCRNGYVGNGTYCEEKQCSNNGKCPATKGSYECASSGLCKCTETFDNQPEGFGRNNLCVCPDGGQIITNNSLPVCVPIGKCLNDEWECKVQVDEGQINQVRCMTYGINTFTLFKDCVCNYGFTGGWEYPCKCDPSRRILWSPSFNGELCLAQNECTVNWHCPESQSCSITQGQQIGLCDGLK